MGRHPPPVLGTAVGDGKALLPAPLPPVSLCAAGEYFFDYRQVAREKISARMALVVGRP